MVEAPRAADVAEPASRSKWYKWRKDGTALVKYLLDSEVHTFAFSVAANAILSFIPFIVLLYTLASSVLRSPMMVTTVNEMVHYFMPSSQDFVAATLAGVAARQGVQVFSLIMIVVACTGIFLPHFEGEKNARAGRTGFLADYDCRRLHGHFSPPRSGPQSSLGSDQEPQLPGQPGGRVWVGDPDGASGHG